MLPGAQLCVLANHAAPWLAFWTETFDLANRDPPSLVRHATGAHAGLMEELLRRRRAAAIGLTVLAAAVLAGCAAGPNDVSSVDIQLAGFWPGVWHGLIYPVTFVISLFTKSVNIYEVRNNGGWYNFGFVLGIAILHTIFAGPAR